MLVSWFRDGVQVDPQQTVRIDEVTSLLAISNLTHGHAGNYSCVAKNEVAVVSVTASLVVRGNYKHQVNRHVLSCSLSSKIYKGQVK